MRNRVAIGLSLMFFFTGCLGASSATSEGTGYAILSLHAAQDFNPNAVHGEIFEYKVSITGDGLIAPLIRYYPSGTSEARFEGLPANSLVAVMVEYINVNGLVVRRGYSDRVRIQGGVVTPVDVTLNNVPIFANVRNGAIVKAERFVPLVFAPGEITVQISDEFNGDVSVLTDATSGEALHSVSVADSSSLLTFHAPPLPPGNHELTVTDTQTGESSAVALTILSGESRPVLVTTSGGLTGLPMSLNSTEGLNAAAYYGQDI